MIKITNLFLFLLLFPVYVSAASSDFSGLPGYVPGEFSDTELLSQIVSDDRGSAARYAPSEEDGYEEIEVRNISDTIWRFRRLERIFTFTEEESNRRIESGCCGLSRSRDEEFDTFCGVLRGYIDRNRGFFEKCCNAKLLVRLIVGDVSSFVSRVQKVAEFVQRRLIELRVEPGILSDIELQFLKDAMLEKTCPLLVTRLFSLGETIDTVDLPNLREIALDCFEEELRFDIGEAFQGDSKPGPPKVAWMPTE